ncbi:MAG: hypothetical protein WBD40_12865 [Tepidisphaeraceae bacterium]
MEARPRMGELLSRMVELSGHDVEEILHEQGTSRRRFGEIALSWGLCQPEHIWSAWCLQVREGLESIDLDRDGIDAQAVALLSADAARVFRAIVIRRGENEIVVASADPLGERSREELRKLLGTKVKFVLAPKRQIDAALEAYYAT